MKIEGKEYRTIWFKNNIVKIIDQTKLPHKFIIKDLKTVKDAINAIKVMEVRGAPLIGATAAYGLVLSAIENKDKSNNKLSKQMRNILLKYCFSSRYSYKPIDINKLNKNLLDLNVYNNKSKKDKYFTILNKSLSKLKKTSIKKTLKKSLKKTLKKNNKTK